MTDVSLDLKTGRVTLTMFRTIARGGNVNEQGRDPREGLVGESPLTPYGEDVHEFLSGAKSSGKLPRFDLIPWNVFAERLAKRYELGLQKYSEDNWKKGLSDPDFVRDRANHTLNHLHKAVEDIRTGVDYPSDDDLAAALWGVICLMAAQELRWTQRRERIQTAAGVVPATRSVTSLREQNQALAQDPRGQHRLGDFR